MSTSTFVISYAYTVTYVTAKLLLTLKEIIREQNESKLPEELS